MRELQSLNEIWDYRAAEGPWDKRAIPYADLPVGFAECRRTFDVPDGCVAAAPFCGWRASPTRQMLRSMAKHWGGCSPMFPMNLK